MILFVGGPLHAEERNVQTLPQSMMDIVAGRDPEYAATYVDVSSKAEYVYLQVAQPVAHLLTGQPDGHLAQRVYLHQQLVGQTVEQRQALADACVRLWFRRGQRVLPDDTQSQRKAVTYKAECEKCVPPANEEFQTAMLRAAWAQTHIANTGHSPLSFSVSTD